MNDADRVELNELCSGAVDATLTAEQRVRLNDLLRGSEEARRFYVRAMRLSASLHSYAAEMQSEPAEPQNVIQPVQWRAWLVPLAAAALVMLGFAFWPTPSGPTEPTVPASEEKIVETDWVARLTGERDCEWIGVAVVPGDELAAGQVLELKSGAAELTFDSGAQVVVEGPARLEVRSAWEAELVRGMLKANVPEEAIGFRVMNAAVEIVDLGTEFSVTASEDGTAEVFVLKGAVEVHPRDTQGKRRGRAILREKQARHFAKAGPVDVRDRELKFQRLMQKVAINRLSKPLHYARWSFDEGKGTVAHPVGPKESALPLAANAATRWVPGKFGTALQLDGSASLQAGLMPPLRRGIRSVAFWLQVPEGESVRAGALVAFPAPKVWGSMVELGWNRTSADGVFGALRMEASTGTVVGSTSLRDGRWHHVAMVLGMPGKNAVRPPFKLYVDGRLESFSGKHPLRRSAERVVEDPLLWVGGAPSEEDYFAGALDELIIADQPLTPQEIRHLMNSNQLLSPEAIAGL